jgi:hypothetical protein
MAFFIYPVKWLTEWRNFIIVFLDRNTKGMRRFYGQYQPTYGLWVDTP